MHRDFRRKGLFEKSPFLRTPIPKTFCTGRLPLVAAAQDVVGDRRKNPNFMVGCARSAGMGLLMIRRALPPRHGSSPGQGNCRGAPETFMCFLSSRRQARRGLFFSALRSFPPLRENILTRISGFPLLPVGEERHFSASSAISSVSLFFPGAVGLRYQSVLVWNASTPRPEATPGCGAGSRACHLWAD